MSWQIELYKTNRGEEPVTTFIERLDITTHAKVFSAQRLLKEYGPILGVPYSKKISRGLYELRIRGEIEVRIFYTFKYDRIYLLHAFQKKSQKTPAKELEIAKDRMSLVN